MFDKIAKAVLAGVLAFATALAGVAIEPGPAGTVQLLTAAGTAVVAGVATWALPDSSIVASTKALVAGSLTVAAGLITASTGHNLTWQTILAVGVAGVLTAGAVHKTPIPGPTIWQGMTTYPPEPAIPSGSAGQSAPGAHEAPDGAVGGP